MPERFCGFGLAESQASKGAEDHVSPVSGGRRRRSQGIGCSAANSSGRRYANEADATRRWRWRSSSGREQLRWLAGRMLAVLHDDDRAREPLRSGCDLPTPTWSKRLTLRRPSPGLTRRSASGYVGVRPRCAQRHRRHAGDQKLREARQVQVPVIIVTGRIAPERSVDRPQARGRLAKPAGLAPPVLVLDPLVEAAEAREA